MSEEIALYRVFIASPSGLEPERAAFVKTLEGYNLGEAIPQQAMFFHVRWEDTLAGVGRPQELINQDLDKCDYFVLVLWDRWGTPPGDSEYTSGTEEEYRRAMEHLHDRPQYPLKEIIVFFKNVDDQRRRDPGDQLRKVLDFRKRVEDAHLLLYYTFDDTAEFEEKLRRHLGKWLRDHAKTSTTRVAQERARVPEVIEVPKPYIAPGVQAVPNPGSPAVVPIPAKGTGGVDG